MNKERSIETLSLDGGALCFHFVNTVQAWRGPGGYDYIRSYNDVLAWSQRLEILDQEKLKVLKVFSEANPAEAEKAVEELKQVRALLYTFFSGLAAGDMARLNGNALHDFNKYLQQAFGHVGFRVAETGIQLSFESEKTDLLEPLWAVMKSCYDVLTLEDRQRIKECGECGWVFLDQTKNNSKRWCNPAFCGSTTKAKRYYQKKKQE